jgi:hypothetical protein
MYFLFVLFYILFVCKRTAVLSSPGVNPIAVNKYRICSRNLRTFFSILAAEKSGCLKYADFFVWRSRSGFYSSITENTVRFVNILL